VCVDPALAAFAALSQPLDPPSWRDLGAIAGPMAVLQLDPEVEPQAPWSVKERFDATIMIFAPTELPLDLDPRVRALDDQDLDEIRSLNLRTQMGDFPPRGLRFGHHFGAHVDGRLVAMAGRRFVIDDRVEISWVSTDPDYRRLGLGAAAVAAVCHEILTEGRKPYLIVVDGNPAYDWYERMGFEPVERIHGTAVTREPRSDG
jgi:GNAT superfamily N-acetyltransferase